MSYKLDKSLSELIGIIIGDGCIRYKNNHYFIEIVGNPKNEKEYYFNYIKNLVIDCVGKKPTIKIRARGLRLKFYSKEFVLYLVNELGMIYGKDKHKLVKIPYLIENNEKLLIPCIRGIVDTDGSVFFAKKEKNLNYPCIEITTTSRNLANQLIKILKNKGFNIRSREENRKDYLTSFRMGLYGEGMFRKWVDDIGFSNIKNIQKVNNRNL